MEESPENKELSYDLRQYRTKEIGEQCLRITEAREKAPHIYYTELEELYVLIHHKLPHQKQDEQEYKNKKDELAKLSNTYRGAWCGEDISSQGCNIIRYKLQELRIWLRTKMEEANLWGSKYAEDDDEL